MGRVEITPEYHLRPYDAALTLDQIKLDLSMRSSRDMLVICLCNVLTGQDPIPAQKLEELNQRLNVIKPVFEQLHFKRVLVVATNRGNISASAFYVVDDIRSKVGSN